MNKLAYFLAVLAVLFTSVPWAGSPVNGYLWTGSAWVPASGDANGVTQIAGTVSSTPAAPSTFGSTSITAAQCSTATSLNSISTFDFVVTGTWTGTLQASKSVDGTTFKVMASTPQGGGLANTSVTANGTYSFNTEGATSARVCGATVTSGTAVVQGRGNTSAGSSVDLIGALAGTAGAPSTAVITVQPPTESTAAIATTTLAGADATISAADTTSAERIITNNGSATAYIALGATAVSGTGIALTVGATYIEDRYRGAIHAIGTGAIDVQKVSP